MLWIGKTLREEWCNYLPPSAWYFDLLFVSKLLNLCHTAVLLTGRVASLQGNFDPKWLRPGSSVEDVSCSTWFRTLIASILHTSGICDQMCYAVHMCYVYPYVYVSIYHIYVESCWVYSESVQRMKLSRRFVCRHWLKPPKLAAPISGETMKLNPSEPWQSESFHDTKWFNE